MLTLNVLLSLIIQSKCRGNGLLSNGKIYSELMLCVSDFDSEKVLLNCFNNETVSKEAYRKLNRFLSRFQNDGKGYPYELIRFERLESSIGNSVKMTEYLRKMEIVCSEIFDTQKLDSLVYTLLEIICQDSSITNLLYGYNFIPKEKLLGSYAHPKRICIESILIGLLYHVHKNPSETERIDLLECPDRRTFQAVHYSDDKSLDIELPISLIDNIRENAMRQKSAELCNPLEYLNDGNVLTELPQKGNIFLYGTGGAGKTTVLKNLIDNKDSVNFYFPLYQYKQELHKNFRSESLWILLNILLKYHYQYEYLTYESLVANEGEENILQQLTELEKMLKAVPVNGKQIFILLLDGLNEMSPDIQPQFISELEWICREWKNVRIVITGRTVPQFEVFLDFQKIEIKGVTDIELTKRLSGVSVNEKLLEILRIPLFLNMYTKENDNLNTRGEILDSYVWNSFKSNEIMRFIARYALPYAAKEMCGDYFTQELSRADLLKAIDNAIDFYLLNDRVFQNYIAPKGINKKVLLECRTRDDFIELILNNIGFVEPSETKPHMLQFVHQYYRDYFAARHMVNLCEAICFAYGNCPVDEIISVIKQLNFDKIWFTDDESGIYILMGEIIGDYTNIPSADDFWYRETVLDKLLDMYRRFYAEFDELRITENVIKVMIAARNGLICDVNFNDLPLPLNIPCNVKFSNKGENPCSFRHSNIYRLGIFSENESTISDENCVIFHTAKWEKYAVYSPDKRFLVVLLDNNYVLLWDCLNCSILWNNDLSAYAEDNIRFEYAEFSCDGTQVIFAANNGYAQVQLCRVDTVTGKIISSDFKNTFAYHDEECVFIEEDIKLQILSQLDHFRKCDFTGAKFMEKDYRGYLSEMGASVDI